MKVPSFILICLLSSLALSTIRAAECVTHTLDYGYARLDPGIPLSPDEFLTAPPQPIFPAGTLLLGTNRRVLQWRIGEATRSRTLYSPSGRSSYIHKVVGGSLEDSPFLGALVDGGAGGVLVDRRINRTFRAPFPFPPLLAGRELSVGGARFPHDFTPMFLQVHPHAPLAVAATYVPEGFHYGFITTPDESAPQFEPLNSAFGTSAKPMLTGDFFGNAEFHAYAMAQAERSTFVHVAKVFPSRNVARAGGRQGATQTAFFKLDPTSAGSPPPTLIGSDNTDYFALISTEDNPFHPENVSHAENRQHAIHVFKVETEDDKTKIVPVRSVAFYLTDSLYRPSVTFTPHGEIVVGAPDGRVTMAYPEELGSRALFEGQASPSPIQCLKVNQSGRWLVSGAEDGSVVLWSTALNLDQRRIQITFPGPVADLNFIAGSADGEQLLVSVKRDHHLELYALPLTRLQNAEAVSRP